MFIIVVCTKYNSWSLMRFHHENNYDNCDSIVKMATTKRRRIGQVYGGRKIIQVCKGYTLCLYCKHELST